MNNGAALLDAAIGGAGVARVAMFLASDAVRAGQLRVVLRDFISPGPTVWAGYLARPHLSARIRSFVDFLTATVPPQVRGALSEGGCAQQAQLPQAKLVPFDGYGRGIAFSARERWVAEKKVFLDSLK